MKDHHSFKKTFSGNAVLVALYRTVRKISVGHKHLSCTEAFKKSRETRVFNRR